MTPANRALIRLHAKRIAAKHEPVKQLPSPLFWIFLAMVMWLLMVPDAKTEGLMIAAFDEESWACTSVDIEERGNCNDVSVLKVDWSRKHDRVNP